MGAFNIAQKALIVRNGMLLLVKKSAEDPIHPGKWEIPGGRMKFGESVEQNIKREVKEETGLHISVGEPFDVWAWMIYETDSSGSPMQTQVVAVARVCEADSDDVSISGQKKEDYLSDARWVPVDDVLCYDIIPEMIPVIQKFLKRLNI